MARGGGFAPGWVAGAAGLQEPHGIGGSNQKREAVVRCWTAPRVFPVVPGLATAAAVLHVRLVCRDRVRPLKRPNLPTRQSPTRRGSLRSRPP